MATRAFQWWLILFGVGVACIAGAHLLIGQPTYIGGGDVNATMDSDLRFFNVLFLGFGLAYVWAARDVARRGPAIDLLGLLFFAGGLARLLAWVDSGRPHWFYVAMPVVEIIVPVANFAIVHLRESSGRRPTYSGLSA